MEKISRQRIIAINGNKCCDGGEPHGEDRKGAMKRTEKTF